MRSQLIIFCVAVSTFMSGCEGEVRRQENPTSVLPSNSASPATTPNNATGAAPTTGTNQSPLITVVPEDKSRQEAMTAIETYNATGKELVRIVGEFTALLNTIKDEASADEAIAKMDGISDRMEAAMNKALALPPLTDAEKIATRDIHTELLVPRMKLGRAMTIDITRITLRRPDYRKKLKRFQDIMNRI